MPKRRKSTGWGVLPIPLGYLLALVVIPNLLIVVISFSTRDFSGGVLPQFSIKAWQEAFSLANLRILVRSVLLAAGVTAGCLAVAYPAALALMQCSTRQRRILLLLIAFPMFVSLLLRIYGWTNVLPSTWRGNICVVGFIMAINYLPFMLLPVVRTLESIDPNLEKAALDLGATPWKVLWLVTLPLSLPGVLAGSALVFIPSLGEYLVPHFIGNGKVTVLGTQVVHEFMDRRDWPFSSALACLLLLLVLLSAFAKQFTRVLAEPLERGGQ